MTEEGGVAEKSAKKSLKNQENLETLRAKRESYQRKENMNNHLSSTIKINFPRSSSISVMPDLFIPRNEEIDSENDRENDRENEKFEKNEGNDDRDEQEEFPRRKKTFVLPPPVNLSDSGSILEALRTLPPITKETVPSPKNNDIGREILQEMEDLMANMAAQSTSDEKFKLEEQQKEISIEDQNKKFILRVKLPDHSYRTFPVTFITKVCDIRDKLISKLKIEKDNINWEEYHIFVVNEGETWLEGDKIFGPLIEEGGQFIFKQFGQEEIDLQAQLEKINQINKEKERLKLENLKKREEANANANIEFNRKKSVMDTEESHLKSLQRKLLSLEEETIALRKKLKSAKKNQKKNQRYIDNSDVVITRKIAEPGGSFATVYQVSVNGWVCAMKELILDGSIAPETFLTEIAVLEALPPHPNIVKFLFYEKSDKRIRLFLTMYHCSLRDIFIQHKEKKKGYFYLNSLKYYLNELINGLCYLHQFNIVHRDLKSGNVFVLTDELGEIKKLCIADYDTATQLDENLTPLRMTIGTPGFMAPEVLNARELGYDLKADIYAFGMMIYELLSLKTPYEECENSFEITARILDGIRPELPPLDDCYSAYIEVFVNCTEKDPTLRPTAIELKEIIQNLPDDIDKSLHYISPFNNNRGEKNTETANP